MVTFIVVISLMNSLLIKIFGRNFGDANVYCCELVDEQFVNKHFWRKFWGNLFRICTKDNRLNPQASVLRKLYRVALKDLKIWLKSLCVPSLSRNRSMGSRVSGVFKLITVNVRQQRRGKLYCRKFRNCVA